MKEEKLTQGSSDSDQKRKEEKNPKEIKNWDFRHPHRVSKEQLESLKSIHNSFALKLSSLYSNLQRETLKVDLKVADQIIYADFIASLSSPGPTYILSLETLPGLALLNFSPSLAFNFVDKMLGGKGSLLELNRELTGIEKSILSKVMFKTLTELQNAWGESIPLIFKNIGFEGKPEVIQIAPDSEASITITLEVKSENSIGSLALCYPCPTLEPVLPKLTNKTLIPLKKKQEQPLLQQEIIGKNLRGAKCLVKAILGNTEVSVGELLNLKEGDVIVLDQNIFDPIKISIGENQKFQAYPGLSGKNKAFQITGN
jgi:flagellar motor switch protein FliM